MLRDRLTNGDLEGATGKARTAYRRVTRNSECFGGNDPSDAIWPDMRLSQHFACCARGTPEKVVDAYRVKLLRRVRHHLHSARQISRSPGTHALQQNSEEQVQRNGRP
jgi:hypothetical protein